MTRKAQFNEPTGKRSVARQMAEYTYTAILNELDNALPMGDEEAAEILREAGIDPEYELKRAMVLVEEEEKRQQKALFERAGIIAEEDADKASEQDILNPILELALEISTAKANGCDQGDCACGESDDCLAKGWEKFVPAQPKQPAKNERAQVRRVLASIPGILAHREVEDRVLIQSLDAALLTMFKIGHAPFSTLDHTASLDQQRAWLRACLDASVDLHDLVFGMSSRTFWRIEVAPETDWLWGLWAEWKELFFVSPQHRVVLAFFEEEHGYQAHRVALQSV